MSKLDVDEYLKSSDLNKIIEEVVNAAYKAQSKNPREFLTNYFKSGEGKITKVKGREILDSRGNPTVEVDVYVDGKFAGRGSAPSGASTGSNEAHELRDEDKDKYLGKGVTKAVSNVSTTINDALKGKKIDELVDLDEILIKTDGTELKQKLGGNAITGTSFALAIAGARNQDKPLFLHLNKAFIKAGGKHDGKKFSLPTPMVNILNGGKHAGGKLKIQEFMIVPLGDKSFKEALRKSTTVYHHLGKILVKAKGLSSKNLGDEGGFAPSLDTPDEALGYIEQAIKSAGYKVGVDVGLALDCASSEFYDKKACKYEIIDGKWVTSEELVAFYQKLVHDHPGLISIEDAMDECDYDGWKLFTQKLGDKCMVVGDDLYTTNTRLIKKGISEKWANALLLKVNQIGTIKESMDAANMIFGAGQNVIVSHRSGETTTNLISDLAVAIGAKYIKTGATARGERIGKYNRLLQIEEYLEENKLL